VYFKCNDIMIIYLKLA